MDIACSSAQFRARHTFWVTPLSWYLDSTNQNTELITAKVNVPKPAILLEKSKEEFSQKRSQARLAVFHLPTKLCEKKKSSAMAPTSSGNPSTVRISGETNKAATCGPIAFISIFEM